MISVNKMQLKYQMKVQVNISWWN